MTAGGFVQLLSGRGSWRAETGEAPLLYFQMCALVHGVFTFPFFLPFNLSSSFPPVEIT